ncbi:MAG: hypothetical protein ACYCVB_03320 [Bacilli bacterium]
MVRKMTRIAGAGMIVAQLSVVGLASAHTRASTPSLPGPPYVYRGVETMVSPEDSWNHVRAQFGCQGQMIVSKNGGWLSLSFIRRSMGEAGIPSALGSRTLNFTVPKSIPVDFRRLPPHSAPGATELGVKIDGRMAAVLPWLKSAGLKDSYVPSGLAMAVLRRIGVKMRWNHSTGSFTEWDIGSPAYGALTTVTSFDSGHMTSTSPGILIHKKGDNWIPADYIANSLDNAGAGITVDIAAGNGLVIRVPSGVRVNLRNLPARRVRKNAHEAPIEINGRIVGYSPWLIPAYGPSTEYLSSEAVMTAVRRIGLNMRWNNSNGTFTKWFITAPSRRPGN